MLLSNHTVVTPTILIVDDEDHNFFALAAVLKSRGYRCLAATGPVEALRILELYPEIKMVLMDIMMRGTDGFDGITMIRQEDRFAKLPVIVVSAMATKEAEVKAFEVGANAFITKPVDIDLLLKQMALFE